MKYSFTLNKTYLLLLIGTLLPFATINVLIVSPAILEINSYYNASKINSNAIITSAMLGYALGPIIYGPLINFFGKRKSVYFGLFFSIFGIFLCIISFFFKLLVFLFVGRFISTVGAVSGMVLSYILIAEYYDAIEARRILSKMVILAFAIIPALIVVLSSYITHFLGWIYCFWFLLIYAILNVILLIKLPFENNNAGHKNQNLIRDSLYGYLMLLKNKEYLSYVFLTGIAVACVYIYASKSPIILINFMGISTEKFGYYNLIPYLGYVIALYFSGKYSNLISYRKIINLSVSIMTLGSLCIVVFNLFGYLNPYSFSLGTFIIFLGSAPIVPNSIVMATKSVNDRNLASSFCSFSYMVSATFITWIAGLYVNKLSYPYSILILISIIIFILIFLNHAWLNSPDNHFSIRKNFFKIS